MNKIYQFVYFTGMYHGSEFTTPETPSKGQILSLFASFSARSERSPFGRTGESYFGGVNPL
jgi:hypothetical protein